MKIEIEALQPGDEHGYEAWAQLYSAAWGGSPLVGEQLARVDHARDPSRHLRRVLARDGTHTVACGLTRHLEIFKDPGLLWIWIGVAPELRGQGLGRTLYADLLAALSPIAPRRLITCGKEDDATTCGFLERRGFTVTERFVCSTLRLDDADPHTLARGRARAAQGDLTSRSLASLRAEDPPDWRRDLWSLVTEIQRDLPSLHEISPMSLESFEHTILDAPTLSDDETLIAFDAASGQMVGLSSTWRVVDVPSQRDTGLTGVRRAWRRRGVATMLKAAVIDACRAHGALTLETENMLGNPMWDINEALGFTRTPAKLSFVCDLTQR